MMCFVHPLLPSTQGCRTGNHMHEQHESVEILGIGTFLCRITMASKWRNLNDRAWHAAPHQVGCAGCDDAAAAAHIQEAVPWLQVQLLLHHCAISAHRNQADYIYLSTLCITNLT